MDISKIQEKRIRKINTEIDAYNKDLELIENLIVDLEKLYLEHDKSEEYKYILKELSQEIRVGIETISVIYLPNMISKISPDLIDSELG